MSELVPSVSVKFDPLRKHLRKMLEALDRGIDELVRLKVIKRGLIGGVTVNNQRRVCIANTEEEAAYVTRYSLVVSDNAERFRTVVTELNRCDFSIRDQLKRIDSAVAAIRTKLENASSLADRSNTLRGQLKVARKREREGFKAGHAEPEREREMPKPKDEAASRSRDERSVEQLKAALAKESDPLEKRKLRSKLRARGHTGGLGGGKGRPAGGAKKKVSKKVIKSV